MSQLPFFAHGEFGDTNILSLDPASDPFLGYNATNPAGPVVVSNSPPSINLIPNTPDAATQHMDMPDLLPRSMHTPWSEQESPYTFDEEQMLQPQSYDHCLLTDAMNYPLFSTTSSSASSPGHSPFDFGPTLEHEHAAIWDIPSLGFTNPDTMAYTDANGLSPTTSQKHHHAQHLFDPPPCPSLSSDSSSLSSSYTSPLEPPTLSRYVHLSELSGAPHPLDPALGPRTRTRAASFDGGGEEGSSDYAPSDSPSHDGGDYPPRMPPARGGRGSRGRGARGARGAGAGRPSVRGTSRALASLDLSPVGPLPVPVPVPNLMKKSRGRKVPSSEPDDDSAGAGGGAPDRRTYVCQVPGCGKCFIRGEHLKRHVRSIHTYDKRQCSHILISLNVS
jgi:hypothetical protein